MSIYILFLHKIYYFICSFFLFSCDEKRKNRTKKEKNAELLQCLLALLRLINTSTRCTYFFVLRTKINQAPKTTAPLIKTYQMRCVVLAALRDFCLKGKNTFYRESGLMLPQAVLYHSVFFFSVHFSFCVAIKKKSELREILFLKYIPIIYFM